MRFMVVTRDLSADGSVLGENTEEYTTKLLEPVHHWCSAPMVKNVEFQMVGDNYVKVLIEQVVD